MNSNGYGALPQTDEDAPKQGEANGNPNTSSSTSSTTSSRQTSTRRLGWVVLGVLLLLGGGWLSRHPNAMDQEEEEQDDESVVTTRTPPYGVNLASWLSLEDYFFVGDAGAVEVATDWGHTAAQCFPPLLPHEASWQSETDLLATLADRTSVREAILAFQAYRTFFVDLETDLARIASAGIRAVRVPVSWCLTDADPTSDPDLDPWATTADAVLWDKYTCLDPFFAKHDGTTVRWPAVPKMLLQRLLRACHAHGLRAVLDVHTYAGGTSIGTFSGVWPRIALFWQYDTPEQPDKDWGRHTWRQFLEWIESLADADPDALAGLGGITPMNEPGHLAGIFGPGSWNPHNASFLPALPVELGDDYRLGVLQDKIPDGPHLRVLKWQSDALEAFRQTTLPYEHHVDLNVNVHESILVRALTPHDENDFGGRHPEATQLIASWWKLVTTPSERAAWAVLDMHHYHAWESACQGTVTGHDGAYTCGDVEAATTVLRQCSEWAQTFRDAVDEPDARLASGEFSASTHHSVLESCIDPTTLGLSYMEQMKAAAAANVDLYFWAWKMPFGGAFRPAWSWQHFQHVLHGDNGAWSADESMVPCGV